MTKRHPFLYFKTRLEMIRSVVTIWCRFLPVPATQKQTLGFGQTTTWKA